MIKHIVMLKLRENTENGTKETNARKLKSMLESLRNEVKGIRSLEVGIDFVHSAASFDLVLTTEFSDEAALDAYRKHPEHVKVAEFVGRVAADRAVVDYEI